MQRRDAVTHFQKLRVIAPKLLTVVVAQAYARLLSSSARRDHSRSFTPAGLERHPAKARSVDPVRPVHTAQRSVRSDYASALIVGPGLICIALSLWGCDISCAGADCRSGEAANRSAAATSKQRAEPGTCTGAEEAAAHSPLPWIVVVRASGKPDYER